jgi:hypothetical protein
MTLGNAAAAYGAVNAVSLYVERGRETFDAVHVEAAARVARLARESGVERLIHVSGIGADPASSAPYIAARGRGEIAVQQAFPCAILIRPAVMFGPDDAFLTTVVRLLRILPVYPMFGRGETFAAELESGATESHALVGNFILCAILGKKPALSDAIKSEQVRMTAAIFFAKTRMNWRETVVNERANKDDEPFLVDDARQRLIDEVDRIRARKEQKGE